MEFFERRYLHTLIPPGIDIPWFRYIDDVLYIWPSHLNVDEFLNQLNNLVPSIKFTLETESNKTLPFLDILIHREDSQFKYSIYRKPTNTLSYIHFYSNHCTTVKRSIFQSMYLFGLTLLL